MKNFTRKFLLISFIFLQFLEASILLQNKSSKPSRKLKENHHELNSVIQKNQKKKNQKMNKNLSNKKFNVSRKLRKNNEKIGVVSGIKKAKDSKTPFERKLSKSKRTHKSKKHQKKSSKKSRTLKMNSKSLKNLEKYAVTSIMTLISLKVAKTEQMPGTKNKGKVKSRKLGLMGKVVNQKNMSQSYEKLKKDLRKYLKNKKIPVEKNLGTNKMEKIVKRYVKDRFKIGGKQFEGVRSLITGFYKLTQFKLRKRV